MADFILNWNALWGATSQKLYYRKKGDSTWFDLATVDRQVEKYRANGFEDNTVYEFQVEDIISLGNVLSNIDDAIVLVCSNVTLTLTGTSLSYSFTPIGEDIDIYTVELFKNGISVQSQPHNSPFSNPVTGTFTGLTPIDTFKLRLKVYSSVGGIKYCDLATVPPVACVKPTDIVGTIS